MPKIVDHDSRKAVFAEAAIRLVARDGLEGLTMRAVAAESGLSYGSLFHYFDSKDDLLMHAIRHTTAESSLAAATEAVRVRQSRFKQGLDKMIDLLDAETGLREAEMRELVARYDVILDTHRLRYVSGASLISTEVSQ